MTRRVYLYFALTLLLGALVGAAGAFCYGWYSGALQRPYNRQRIVRRMTRELDLTDTQVHQLDQILDEYRNKYTELQKEVKPQFDALREANRSRVRQILTPAQSVTFNDLIRRRDERMKERRSP
jgi:Spy/CpxP family protein refolding chaperone